MRAVFNLQFLFSFLLASAVAGLPSSANALMPPEPTTQFSTRFFTQSSYFETKANYDVKGGSFTRLGNSRYYKLIEGHIGVEHWLAENVSAFVQMGYAQASSYDGALTRTSATPTELITGVRYMRIGDRFNLMPEFWLAYPFNEYANDTDKVLTGEGVMKFFAGLWAEYELGRLKPFSKVGFLYQDDGRASHFTYEAGANWAVASWLLNAQLYGTHVVIKDDFSDFRIERDILTTRVNGGSWKFNSVDPQVLGVQVQAFWDLNENLRFNLGYDRTLNGQASAAGWTALAGLQYFILNEDARPRRSRAVPASTEESLLTPYDSEKNFEPEPQKYDESLFVDEVKKPKIKSKKLKPTVRRKAPAKKIKRPNLDSSLDDVQKSLEN